MRYHSNEELAETTRSLATLAGARASLRVLGASRGGEELLAVTVSAPGRRPDPRRPQALVTANVHGTEVIGSELALRLLQLCAQPEPVSEVQSLLALADLTLVPTCNPDSRRSAAEALRRRRGLGGGPRGNAAGVDLNRNFPPVPGARDVWHPLAGSSRPWLPWYRGQSPLSEPEARALAGLVNELVPVAALSLHSVGALVLYPWCYTGKPPADRAAFEAMGRAFVAAQSCQPYTVKQAHAWYTILGDMDDWMYATHGTLAVTVELGRTGVGLSGDPLRLLSSLWWMNPADPGPTLAHTDLACVAALVAGLQHKRPQTAAE